MPTTWAQLRKKKWLIYSVHNLLITASFRDFSGIFPGRPRLGQGLALACKAHNTYNHYVEAGPKSPTRLLSTAARKRARRAQSEGDLAAPYYKSKDETPRLSIGHLSTLVEVRLEREELARSADGHGHYRPLQLLLHVQCPLKRKSLKREKGVKRVFTRIKCASDIYICFSSAHSFYHYLFSGFPISRLVARIETVGSSAHTTTIVGLQFWLITNTNTARTVSTVKTQNDPCLPKLSRKMVGAETAERLYSNARFTFTSQMHETCNVRSAIQHGKRGHKSHNPVFLPPPILHYY